MKRQVLALAEQSGASVEIDSAGTVFHVTIESPKNKVFNASMCHCVVSWVYHPFSTKSVWKALLADLKEGMTDCADDDCDYCSPT